MATWHNVSALKFKLPNNQWIVCGDGSGEIQSNYKYLYNLGNECTSVTGGYIDWWSVYYGYYIDPGIQTKLSDHFHYGDNSGNHDATASSSYRYGSNGFCTTLKVDFTGWNYICCDVSLTNCIACIGTGGTDVYGSWGFQICNDIWSGRNASFPSASLIGGGSTFQLGKDSTGSGRRIVKFDCSSITGEYYIVVWMSCYYYTNQAGEIDLYRLWLEK